MRREWVGKREGGWEGNGGGVWSVDCAKLRVVWAHLNVN